MCADDLLMLEERLPSPQSEFLRLAGESHNASIVIGKHDRWSAVQCCLKYPFAGDIKTGTIDERKNMSPHRTR